MKRLTFIYEDGTVAVWQADSASWGDASRNVVLRRAKLMSMGDVTDAAGGSLRVVEMALVPLAVVRAMMEEEL